MYQNRWWIVLWRTHFKKIFHSIVLHSFFVYDGWMGKFSIMKGKKVCLFLAVKHFIHDFLRSQFLKILVWKYMRIKEHSPCYEDQTSTYVSSSQWALWKKNTLFLVTIPFFCLPEFFSFVAQPMNDHCKKSHLELLINEFRTVQNTFSIFADASHNFNLNNWKYLNGYM